MSDPDLTAFGAAWSAGVHRAAAVLRAQAARTVPLVPVAAVDAAAAVLAGHVWSTVTGETSLLGAHRHPTSVQAVAAAVLSRSAGYRTGPGPATLARHLAAIDPAHVSRDTLVTVAAGLGWVTGEFPDTSAAAQVFAAAADDLLLAGTGPLAGVGAMCADHAILLDGA